MAQLVKNPSTMWDTWVHTRQFIFDVLFYIVLISVFIKRFPLLRFTDPGRNI